MKFKAPADIRPTTNKLKEAIFNILRSELGGLERLHCLDLFAGSGALGLTALINGAEKLVCIDSSFQSYQAIKENAEKLDLNAKVQIIKADVFKFKTAQKFNLVFADPPYAIKEEQINRLLNLVNNLLAEDGLLVLELREGTKFKEEQAGLNLLLRRNYGDSELRLWKRNNL